jgi:hypothetical protein
MLRVLANSISRSSLQEAKVEAVMHKPRATFDLLSEIQTSVANNIGNIGVFCYVWRSDDDFSHAIHWPERPA